MDSLVANGFDIKFNILYIDENGRDVIDVTTVLEAAGFDNVRTASSKSQLDRGLKSKQYLFDVICCDYNFDKQDYNGLDVLLGIKENPMPFRILIAKSLQIQLNSSLSEQCRLNNILLLEKDEINDNLAYYLFNLKIMKSKEAIIRLTQECVNDLLDQNQESYFQMAQGDQQISIMVKDLIVEVQNGTELGVRYYTNWVKGQEKLLERYKAMLKK